MNFCEFKQLHRFYQLYAIIFHITKKKNNILPCIKIKSVKVVLHYFQKKKKYKSHFIK